MNNSPKLYGKLASWFPLLSPPSEYIDEAAFIRQTLTRFSSTTPHSLLEFGSGGGNNAFHLKKWFQMTLVDRSKEILNISRNLNPECDHILGDMRKIRLGQLFDAVLIHDAIMYITTLEDLRRVMETAYQHCRKGSVIHILPDCIRETFEPKTTHGGQNGNGRALRYVSWAYDPDESDTQYVVDMGYLIRDGNSSVKAVHDRHIFGLFSKNDWLRVINEAGFTSTVITDNTFGRDTFIGIKPR